MNGMFSKPTRTFTGQAMQMRQAVLLTFGKEGKAAAERCLNSSRRDWLQLERWLDTSGLSLYWLDRLEDLQLVAILPLKLCERMQHHRIENRERTEEMMTASVEIQCRFQQHKLQYAVMKGCSLSPVSVPKIELRSQLDLDFLVAEESSVQASEVLEALGYERIAISGNTWEFRSKHGFTPRLKDLYKPGACRSVELHITSSKGPGESILERSIRWDVHGILMPMLAEDDLFVAQAIHLYKHLSTGFTRTAHVLEFHRHVVAQYSDHKFWEHLQQKHAGSVEVCRKIGLVVQLISDLMGEFAPAALTSWTVIQLPPAALEWIRWYGRQSLLASFPGNKLYLLLQQVMRVDGLPKRGSLSKSLIPRRLPPPIAFKVPQEPTGVRTLRLLRQFRFIVFRLRFHSFEGTRYLWESFRWRQRRHGAES